MGQSMRKWTGLAWRVLAALCALLATGLAGCGWFDTGDSHTAYGPPYVPPVPLTVRNFSYQPPGPIHVGDTITFIVEIPEGELSQVYAQAALPATDGLYVMLHDDGLAPDTVAGDRIFSGKGQWQAGFGTGSAETRAVAHGYLQGKYAAGSMAGPPLDVLP